MYPQAPPVCTLQIAFPLSPPNLLLLPSPPHPGPIFHPPRILIPATCPRYRRSPAWPHVWVSPPPLSLPERPHRWVRGGCTPRALHGVVGGRFLRGAVGMGCAARGVPAAVRGAAPHRSFPPAEGAPPVSGGGDAHCWGGGGDGLGSPRSQTPPGGSSQHPVSPRQRHDGPPRPPFGQLAASRRHHTPR